jgi:hypothetical protein
MLDQRVVNRGSGYGPGNRLVCQDLCRKASGRMVVPDAGCLLFHTDCICPALVQFTVKKLDKTSPLSRFPLLALPSMGGG